MHHFFIIKTVENCTTNNSQQRDVTVKLNVPHYEDKESLTQLEKILLVILSQLEEKDTLKYIECFEEIIKETRHVFYRPMIYMFKAKYVLHVDKNQEYAEELYGKAVTSAELLGDELLAQRILEEKQGDFSAT